jgi:hypothetical protein
MSEDQFQAYHLGGTIPKKGNEEVTCPQYAFSNSVLVHAKNEWWSSLDHQRLMEWQVFNAKSIKYLIRCNHEKTVVLKASRTMTKSEKLKRELAEAGKCGANLAAEVVWSSLFARVVYPLNQPITKRRWRRTTLLTQTPFGSGSH